MVIRFSFNAKEKTASKAVFTIKLIIKRCSESWVTIDWRAISRITIKRARIPIKWPRID
jgi:hypothetical protein